MLQVDSWSKRDLVRFWLVLVRVSAAAAGVELAQVRPYGTVPCSVAYGRCMVWGVSYGQVERSVRSFGSSSSELYVSSICLR